MNLRKEPSELAKRYIDASLQARARRGAPAPSKAAYARALRLARVAMEERGRFLPGWLLRYMYRPLIPATVSLFAKASNKRSTSAGPIDKTAA